MAHGYDAPPQGNDWGAFASAEASGPAPPQSDLSQETSARIAGDNQLSQHISVLSQHVSVEDAALSVRIDEINVAVASVTSQEFSVLSNRVSVTSAAVTSVDSRVNTVSHQVSVLSQNQSVLSQNLSVVSSKVSTVSIAVTSVDNRLNNVSAMSVGDVSTAGLQSVIDALSGRISAISNTGTGPSQLISGGGVAWTGTGFNYIISSAIYLINGVIYSSPQTPVTLDPSDPLLDRHDTFYVDTSGLAGVLTGVAGSGIAPSVDPATQLLLQTADIPAGSSQPVITNENIYLEDTEYTMSTSSGNIVLNSTNNPFAGTKDIEGTATVNGNLFTAVKPSGTLDLTQYSQLVLQVRSKATWPSSKGIAIFWMNGAVVVGSSVALKNGTFGFDSSNTSSYQQIVIPIGNFAAGSSAIDRLRMTVSGGGAAIGWYIDNIILQAGGGGGGGGDITRAEFDALSNQVSVLSQDQSVLSQKVSVLSSQVSTVSVAVTSVDNRVNTISQQVSVLSQSQSVLSQNVSVLSNQVSTLSAQVSTVSIAVTSVDTRLNTVSNQVSVLSQQVSVISQKVSVLSSAVSVLQAAGGGSVTSQEFSVLSSQVSTVSIAVTSVDTRLNTVSQQVSVLSQQVSVLSQGHSVLSQSVSVLSQAVSVLSQAVSVLSASSNFVFTTQTDTDYTLALADKQTGVKMNSASAHNLTVPPNSSIPFPLWTQILIEQAGTGAVTIVAGAGVTLQGSLVLSQQYSSAVLIKQATDTWLVSGSVDVVSLVQVASAAATSVDTRLNTVSQQVSVLSQAQSVLSQAVSVLSQNVSVISNKVSTLSGQVSTVSVAVTSVDARVNTISQQVSVLSQLCSIQSAGLGTVQMKVTADLQGVSSTAAAGVKISGLSISVAASGVYQLDAKLLYSTSGTANAHGFGMSTSGATFGAVGGRWLETISIVNQGTAGAFTFGTFNAINSPQVSAIPGTTGVLVQTTMDALVVVSTTGGTIRLKARVSAAASPINIVRGYFRAFKIG